MFVALELRLSCLATRFGQLLDTFRFQMCGRVLHIMSEAYSTSWERVRWKPFWYANPHCCLPCVWKKIIEIVAVRNINSKMKSNMKSNMFVTWPFFQMFVALELGLSCLVTMSVSCLTCFVFKCVVMCLILCLKCLARCENVFVGTGSVILLYM